MAPKSRRYCPGCKRETDQVHYDDYRPGKPYEYYQCTECGSCWYKCPVHKKFEADISSYGKTDCTCYKEDFSESGEQFESYVSKSYCPICGEIDCEHFIGWTNDGKTIEFRNKEILGEPLQETDFIVKTGVTARVYREVRL